MQLSCLLAADCATLFRETRRAAPQPLSRFVYRYRKSAKPMTYTTRALRGMAVAPHALASQSALGVLREGGNALEAMIAAAATIPVVYPHMNSLGGDSFWLVHTPYSGVRGIDACGGAARAATIDWYKERGLARS